MYVQDIEIESSAFHTTSYPAVADSHDIIVVDDVTEKVKKVLAINGPVFCEVVVDSKQNFEPKLSSKVLPDGRIVSPPIDDMYPFLPKEEYDNIHKEASEI